MNQKVILISIDGMRPDGFLQCGNPFIHDLMARSSYTLEGSSVNPSKYAGGRSAMYYGWEPIREVSRPGSLKHAEYIWAYTTDHTDRLLTESALRYIKKEKPDFEAGKKLSEISLIDIAPTIADIMGVVVPQEWEGKSIVKVEG